MEHEDKIDEETVFLEERLLDEGLEGDDNASV